MFATLYECSTHGLVIASYGCCVCASLRRDCYVRLLSDHERVSEACVPWRSGRFDPDGHILPRGPPRCQQIAENPWYHCVTIRYKAPLARPHTHTRTHTPGRTQARARTHTQAPRGANARTRTRTRAGARIAPPASKIKHPNGGARKLKRLYMPLENYVKM